MTAVLPGRTEVSEQDRLRREVGNLRAIVGALLDELVANDVVHAANYSIHPRTAAELDEIAEASRERHTLIALAAINAKDQP
jgi:hypothetical protein